MNLSTEAKALLSVAAFSVALLIGAVFFFTKSAPTPQNPPALVEESKLIKPDSYKAGPDSAKVKIVEFADFQCPACKIAYPTVEKIKEDYKDQVQFVFRHFPLPQHQYGYLSAKAAEAAGEQGKFWEYYKKLFDNQENWSENQNPKDDFIEYASELGLDIDKFRQTIDSNKYEDKISTDRSEGNSIGVNSTPTFYINGQKYQGALSYQEFKNQVDQLLK